MKILKGLVLVVLHLCKREELLPQSKQQNIERSWRDLKILLKLLPAIFFEVPARADQHVLRTQVVNLALHNSLPLAALQPVYGAIAIQIHTLYLLHCDFRVCKRTLGIGFVQQVLS